MFKLTTLFTLALLLSFTLSFASRPNPGSSLPEDVTNNKISKAELDDENCEGVEATEECLTSVNNKISKAELDDENCEGVEATEECLTRRTLAAHLDYIYTQKHKPKN